MVNKRRGLMPLHRTKTRELLTALILILSIWCLSCFFSHQLSCFRLHVSAHYLLLVYLELIRFFIQDLNRCISGFCLIVSVLMLSLRPLDILIELAGRVSCISLSRP